MLKSLYLENENLTHSIEFFYAGLLIVDYKSKNLRTTYDKFVSTKQGLNIIMSLVDYLKKNKKYGFYFSGKRGNFQNEFKQFLIDNFGKNKNPIDILMSSNYKVLRLNFD